MRTDEELLLAHVAGDEQAFRELFSRYETVLHRTLSRQLFSPEEANDLVQQTFLQVHRARLDFDQTLRFRPWLFTIALNLKREFFRRQRRRPETLMADPGADLHVGPVGVRQVNATRTLAWAMDQLPEHHREVIELHWFAGLSFAEVAKSLGIATATAKVRAHRGYVRLRELLEDGDTELRNPMAESPYKEIAE